MSEEGRKEMFPAGHQGLVRGRGTGDGEEGFILSFPFALKFGYRNGDSPYRGYFR